MTRQRWPFQATIEDKKLIDAINAARPLDRTSVADGIRYALRYTAANDKEIGMNAQMTAEKIYTEVFGHIDSREIRQRKTGEIEDWLNDGDADDNASIELLSEEWRAYDPEAAPESALCDRPRQIGWIRELAASLAEMNADEASAEQIVHYAMGEEGRADLDITLPLWFDSHDMMLLTEYTQEAMA